MIINRSADYEKLVNREPGKKLVLLSKWLKPVHSTIYYATNQNFTGQVLYHEPELFLVEEAARKLSLVQDSLQVLGLDLMIYDCYRPHSVTRKMWAIVPDERYAANPAKGSGHNRGVAIDLTLVDANSLKLLDMPTDYDNFSDTAHHGFMQLPEASIKNRDLLKGIMEYFGFAAFSTEWWHYSLPNASIYPVIDLSFSALKKLGN